MFRRNPVWTVFWEIIIENTKKNSYKSHEIPLNHHCWSNTPANTRKPAATPFGPGNGMQHLKSPLIGSRHDISTRRCPGYAPQVWLLGIPQLICFVSIFVGNVRKSLFKWKRFGNCGNYLSDHRPCVTSMARCRLLIRAGFIDLWIDQITSNKAILSPYHVGLCWATQQLRSTDKC